MKEFQEHLARAAAIARLESVLHALQGERPVLSEAHRTWFVELLHPFSDGDGAQSCALRPSADVSPTEGGAIIAVLLNELGSDAKELERRVDSLVALRRALLNSVALDDSQAETARQIARRLRNHFVGRDTPAAPGTVALA